MSAKMAVGSSNRRLVPRRSRSRPEWLLKAQRQDTHGVLHIFVAVSVMRATVRSRPLDVRQFRDRAVDVRAREACDQFDLPRVERGALPEVRVGIRHCRGDAVGIWPRLGRGFRWPRERRLAYTRQYALEPSACLRHLMTSSKVPERSEAIEATRLLDAIGTEPRRRCRAEAYPGRQDIEEIRRIVVQVVSGSTGCRRSGPLLMSAICSSYSRPNLPPSESVAIVSFSASMTPSTIVKYRSRMAAPRVPAQYAVQVVAFGEVRKSCPRR